MSDYRYDGNRVSTRIYDRPDGAMILLNSRAGRHLGAVVPPDERGAAAQALAGDKWAVITADSFNSLRDRIVQPEPIDPADVEIGYVVEVEADDGSWLVRGEVAAIDGGDAVLPFLIKIGGNVAWPSIDRATVRLVRPAEPEPDPEQVELWADALSVVWSTGEVSSTDREVAANLIRELTRRGVTIGGAS